MLSKLPSAWQIELLRKPGRTKAHGWKQRWEKITPRGWGEVAGVGRVEDRKRSVLARFGSVRAVRKSVISRTRSAGRITAGFFDDRRRAADRKRWLLGEGIFIGGRRPRSPSSFSSSSPWSFLPIVVVCAADDDVSWNRYKFMVFFYCADLAELS